MSDSKLTNGCKKAIIELGNYDLTLLQMACMDRLTNLRAFIRGADARNESDAAARLKRQLDQVEDLLARLVML